MKSYTITVNGNAYDVTVEENGSTAAPTATAQKKVVAPVAAAAPQKATGAGNIQVEAGASGKVFKIEAQVGTVVKTGDAIVVLEIMKMETPVVAQKDGTVASIDVTVGQSVEAGDLLATINA